MLTSKLSGIVAPDTNLCQFTVITGLHTMACGHNRFTFTCTHVSLSNSNIISDQNEMTTLALHSEHQGWDAGVLCHVKCSISHSETPDHLPFQFRSFSIVLQLQSLAWENTQR